MGNLTNWSELIVLNNNGLYVAPFNVIRDSIISKYKEIYGNDIVVSDASADGIFVNQMSLMINNILQSFKQFYDNMKLETASGIYLDNLCALSNMYRHPATKSSVQLILTNIGESPISKPLEFVDNNGFTWVWENREGIVIDVGKSKNIIAECTETGPIEARAGSITKLVNTSISATVLQEYDAVLGYDKESDYDLRIRKKQYNMVGATSTLEGLYNELYGISGIEDVYIYNNNSNVDKIMSDNANVGDHDVYVVIRQRFKDLVEDKRIADIIYNYLTPGIRSFFTVSEDKPLKNGYAKSYNLTVDNIGQSQNVMWKEAQEVKGSITLSLTVTSSFSDNTLDSIANNVRDYLNGLSINEIIKLQTSKSDVDLRFAVMSSGNDYYINNITGFEELIKSCNYSYYNIKGEYNLVSTTDTTRVITIS